MNLSQRTYIFFLLFYLLCVNNGVVSTASFFSRLLMIYCYCVECSEGDTQDLEFDWKPVPGFVGPRGYI